jgi:hypothetical protein
MSANVEDNVSKSNTQSESMTSKIKEHDEAKEEKLTTVSQVVISLSFLYLHNNLVLGYYYRLLIIHKYILYLSDFN